MDPGAYELKTKAATLLQCMGVSINVAIQHGWFIVENPKEKWMISGYPYFRKPPYWIFDYDERHGDHDCGRDDPHDTNTTVRPMFLKFSFNQGWCAKRKRRHTSEHLDSIDIIDHLQSTVD